MPYAALELHNTHFSNACGLMRRTLFDRRRSRQVFSEIALHHPVSKELVREESGKIIMPINEHRAMFLRTTNRLLYRIPGVQG